jgi:hypothetical protein
MTGAKRLGLEGASLGEGGRVLESLLMAGAETSLHGLLLLLLLLLLEMKLLSGPVDGAGRSPYRLMDDRIKDGRKGLQPRLR